MIEVIYLHFQGLSFDTNYGITDNLTSVILIGGKVVPFIYVFDFLFSPLSRKLKGRFTSADMFSPLIENAFRTGQNKNIKNKPACMQRLM